VWQLHHALDALSIRAPLPAEQRPPPQSPQMPRDHPRSGGRGSAGAGEGCGDGADCDEDASGGGVDDAAEFWWLDDVGGVGFAGEGLWSSKGSAARGRGGLGLGPHQERLDATMKRLGPGILLLRKPRGAGR